MIKTYPFLLKVKVTRGGTTIINKEFARGEQVNFVSSGSYIEAGNDFRYWNWDRPMLFK